jgi:hypothetical protein
LPRHQHGSKLHLVLDYHSVRRCAVPAEQFELHFVPAGPMDMGPPLDRYVFGTLKSIAHRMYRGGHRLRLVPGDRQRGLWRIADRGPGPGTGSGCPRGLGPLPA